MYGKDSFATIRRSAEELLCVIIRLLCFPFGAVSAEGHEGVLETQLGHLAGRWSGRGLLCISPSKLTMAYPHISLPDMMAIYSF